MAILSKRMIGYVFDFAPQRALIMQQTIAKNQAKLNDQNSIEKILTTNSQDVQSIYCSSRTALLLW